MGTYTFKFTGRQARAIGITYRIQDTYKCNSLSEAKSMLYKDYDLIQGIQITAKDELGRKIEISQAEFNDAPFVDVSNYKRTLKENGSYFYTRSNSPQE